MEITELLQSYFSLTPLYQYSYEDKLVSRQEFSTLGESKLEDLLRDENCYNVVSPMNSGKTYSILKLSHLRRILTIMCVPLTALGSQIKDKLELTNIPVEERNGEEPIPIFFVHGKDNSANIAGTSDFEINRFCQSENVYCIVCVYESLVKLIQEPLMSNLLRKYNLIIDESHNLVTQSEFRYNAINTISKYASEFRKVIYLSGTPEMTILNEYPTIRFIPNHPKVKLNHVNIIIYEKSPLHKLVSHITSVRIEGKSVILCDNIKMLDDIKSSLIIHGFEEEQILILTRHVKYSEEFMSTMREEMIPEQVKFLLATRVISDGINLFNENIERVYFLMVDDVYLKRQFIGRFRHATPDVFDFVSLHLTHHPEIERLYDIEAQQISNDNDRCILLNQIPYNESNRSQFQKERQLYTIRNDSNPIIFDGKYKVAIERHRKKTLNFLSEYLHSNEHYLQRFYVDICGLQCCSFNYEELKNQNVITERYSAEELNNLLNPDISIDLSIPQNITMQYDTLISAFIQNKKKALNKYSDKQFYTTEVSQKYIQANRSIFTEELDIFTHCIELLNSGLSWGFVKEYFRLYYSEDQSGKIELKNFFHSLLIYLDYCFLSRLSSLQEMVIDTNKGIMNEYKVILKIISKQLGVYDKSEIKSFIETACAEVNIPTNKLTADNYLSALFEYSVYKPTTASDRKLKFKLFQLKNDSDPTSFFLSFKTINKMDHDTLISTIEKWYRSTLVRGYYLICKVDSEMLTNTLLEQALNEFREEIKFMCEGAVKYG